MDVKFIDASDWLELEWYNSGGTRAKRVLQSPDNAEWYFKCSERKPPRNNQPEKYYKYEFWSEIVAYQLGNLLGLNVLRYDIALHANQIGCISPLMIDRDKEQLIEVGRYMTSLNPAFLPEDNSTRHEYTFQLLENTIDKFSLSKYLPLFFKTILFDAVIGNTDRHQENWAFLGRNTFISEPPQPKIEQPVVKNLQVLKNFFKHKWRQCFGKEFELNVQDPKVKLQMTNLAGMAPIYDNGSSLARELTDEKIDRYLKDQNAFEKYVDSGKAEVHWNNKKLSHFELIGHLLNSSYLEEVVTASSFLLNWNDEQVKQIVSNIDRDVPQAWHSYRIPNSRKELMVKLLISRSKKLTALIDDRV